jgi:hypothetical protein
MALLRPQRLPLYDLHRFFADGSPFLVIAPFPTNIVHG